MASISSRRRLFAALDSFVRHRQGGARSKRHIVPLVEFAAAEFRSRGVRSSAIKYEAIAGRFYQRQVDLVIETNDETSLNLVVITQSGSVRKNLNNRRRDIVGDAVNLRASEPNSMIAVIYLLRADEEATKKGSSGTSPIDELAAFLSDLQTATTPLGRPLLDAAALLAADRDASGKICIHSIPEDVDVLKGFFDKLANSLGKREALAIPERFRPHIVQPSMADRYVSCVPLLSLRAAAGDFGDSQHIEAAGWVEVNTQRTLREGMFVALVEGASMEPLIPNGSYCLFTSPVTGSRQGRTVLVQHHTIEDPETGGSFTVKKYSSEKEDDGEGGWRHRRIVLNPLNNEYQPIVLDHINESEISVVAEFLEVIGGCFSSNMET